jgi:hypothetical protein
METDVYVGSSVVAANIVGLTRGYTRSVSTNIALVMQGETEEELPESLLSCACLREIDVDMRFKLDSLEAELADSSIYMTSDAQPTTVETSKSLALARKNGKHLDSRDSTGSTTSGGSASTSTSGDDGSSTSRKAKKGAGGGGGGVFSFFG